MSSTSGPGAGSQPRPALAPLTFRAFPGEVIAVIGHNGAGKSTLFDLLAGLGHPSSGRVATPVGSGKLTWCPQREIIDWLHTVRRNVLLGYRLRAPAHRAEREAEIQRVASILGLTVFLDRTAETQSGGQLRRTQIAGAMVGSPRLMLLDEPTTELDPEGIGVVFTELARHAAAGGASLISTHETARFADHCTRVLALGGGGVLCDEPIDVFRARLPGAADLWEIYQTLAGASA
ncbi:ATP-binding cassette domain-containing protein [Mycetocola tolaasinivorans]|uniref:ATP-binding cassette domain-containing protein n=1 Tax=Mycetocola tolaasinivorans TaxID=76635 RepID=UPI0015FFCB93|nr:ABC transporter ATP-binding protein [Mycetocola tolaasinivorans]